MANGGEAGVRWFSMAFIKTEHCYVFMYVTNADDPFSLCCHSCLFSHAVIVGLGLEMLTFLPFTWLGYRIRYLTFQS
jgi:hypothetical protein